MKVEDISNEVLKQTLVRECPEQWLFREQICALAQAELDSRTAHPGETVAGAGKGDECDCIAEIDCGTPKQCMAHHEHGCCTRPAGHDGDHVACEIRFNRKDNVHGIARWHNESAKPPAVSEKPTQADREEGLKMKYRIAHADGSPCDKGAEYFVLRMDYHDGCDRRHVEACREAIRCYAAQVLDHLPVLANELLDNYQDDEAKDKPEVVITAKAYFPSPVNPEKVASEASTPQHLRKVLDSVLAWSMDIENRVAQLEAGK